MFDYITFSTVILLFSISTSIQEHSSHKDYKDHECARPCNNQTTSRLCSYDFDVEWYSVLSTACLDCPFNRTNCDRSECITTNGYPRAVLTVNRMLPGPSLTVCEGDMISVRVKNSLHFSEATTIHWHGLKQKKSPYMDGVNMVTQCPIIAHTSFEYRFEADSYGTHFWHAHAGLQRSDGFFGPLIVHQYENKDPHVDRYDYDLQEHVITVNDWINGTSIEKFAGHHHNDGDNKPRSILINGKGVLVNITDTRDNQVYQTPRAVFSVEKGKRYRFRMINAGILYCPIEFSVDNHNLTVIATDGNNIEPYEVQSLIIMAGERYDFVLHAYQDINNYWIRAKGFADCGNFKVFQTAILNYKVNGLINELIPSGPLLEYDTMSREGLQLNPWNRAITPTNRDSYTSVNELKSVRNEEITNFYDKILNATNVKTYYLAMEFNKINNPEFNDERSYSINQIRNFGRNPLYTPQINNISLNPPNSPILYEWDSVPKDKICNSMNKEQVCMNKTFCSCLYTYEFELNDVVEFVIVDEGFTFQSNHPMHLHGHRYAVLGLDKLNRSIKLDEIKRMDQQGLIKRNLEAPPLKDTVTVPVGGYTIIRFLTDNPGTWLFHCHLEFHSEIGMAFLVKVGEKKDLPAEPRNWPKCGDFVFTGNSATILITSKKILLLFLTISFVFFI